MARSMTLGVFLFFVTVLSPYVLTDKSLIVFPIKVDCDVA